MRRLFVATLALGLFSAAMWFAFLGWDHDYYEVNGVAQGPYRPWQVVGCGAAITAAAVLAYLAVRRTVSVFLLSAAAVIGFAVPWSADAAATDDSGLWMVGLFMLLVGGGVGMLVVLGVLHAVITSGRRPASPAAPAA